uniref:Anthranilate N-benzoyltransferase protein 1 n=1 Tax=Aegilops tauschii subsp. strangulata TaxID=200361 RepID=A0A453QPE0_AEGTS
MPLERFDVRILSRELVRASDPPPGFPAVHAVSNLDLLLGPFPIYLLCIYPPPPGGLGPVLAAVRAALPAYLSRFFPFAGRVVRRPDTNVPEVACDNAGAELVVADAAGVPLSAVDFARVDRSLGMVQIPFDAGLALSLQLVRFACGGPATMINPLLAAAMERRLYRIDAADLAGLQIAASSGDGGRRTSRFVALCAHVWKLLARAVGDSDPNCRMAWIVDGRKCVEPSEGALDLYMGNVVTYTAREASVAGLLRAPLHEVAAAARAAMASVMTRGRFQELVDWVEVNKTAYKDGGKWTEAVNLGLGSPALVISGLLPFAIDGDLGFGKPRLVLPWLRHGRLGSASVTVVPCPGGDGSWFVGGTRLWPRLVEVIEAGPESLLKPVTAASLGFEAPHGSRL